MRWIYLVFLVFSAFSVFSAFYIFFLFNYYASDGSCTHIFIRNKSQKENIAYPTRDNCNVCRIGMTTMYSFCTNTNTHNSWVIVIISTASTYAYYLSSLIGLVLRHDSKSHCCNKWKMKQSNIPKQPIWTVQMII